MAAEWEVVDVTESGMNLDDYPDEHEQGVEFNWDADPQPEAEPEWPTEDEAERERLREWGVL